MEFPNGAPQGGLQLDLKARPVQDEDAPILKQLRNEFDSERLLFDQAQLKEDEKKFLLNLQEVAHQKHFEDANWEKTTCAIELNEEVIGTFTVFQDKEEIRLADIVISGKCRGMGIGFAMIQSIQQEAVQSKRPLRLHVDKMNPALQLYEQMGFQLLEDRVTHLFLEWVPPNMQGTKIYFPGQ